jgi:tetratricopeptide (TPR) repeat protein
MAESLFTRFWNVLKPPPAVPKPDATSLAQRRRQRRLVRIAFGVILLAAAGAWIYNYIASAPQRADVVFQAGMKLMSPGTYAAAIAQFNKAIEIWPQSGEAYLERGVAHRYLGETEQALADFDKAIDVNPNLARAYSARGGIYRARGDVKRALEDFTKSISIQSNVDAYFERGQTYEALGQHQKAIDDYNSAIAELPEAPYVYRARSLARRNLGDTAGYEADRDKARNFERR